jgi:hypothetical protein
MVKNLLESLATTEAAHDMRQADSEPEQPFVVKRSVKEWCREIIHSDTYRKSLRDRIFLGSLAPAVECRLWDYAYGKPVDRVEVHDKSTAIESLTPEQINRRIEALKMIAERLRGENESAVVH